MIIQTRLLLPARILLGYVGVCIVGVFLVLLKLAVHVLVRSGCRHFARLGARIGRFRQSILAGFVRQFFQASVHLLPKVIVHFLQIVGIDGYTRTNRAVVLLARSDGDSHVMVFIDLLAGPLDDISGIEIAIVAIVIGDAQVVRNHEVLELRVEPWRQVISARRLVLATSRVFLVGDALFYLVGERLLQLGTQLGSRCRSTGLGRSCAIEAAIGESEIARDQIVRG